MGEVDITREGGRVVERDVVDRPTDRGSVDMVDRARKEKSWSSLIQVYLEGQGGEYWRSSGERRRGGGDIGAVEVVGVDLKG